MAPAAGRESGGGRGAGGKPAFARPKPKRKREDHPQEPAKVRRAAQPAKGQGQAQGKKAALERMRSLMQQAEGAAPAEKRRLLKECAATPPFHGPKTETRMLFASAGSRRCRRRWPPSQLRPRRQERTRSSPWARRMRPRHREERRVERRQDSCFRTKAQDQLGQAQRDGLTAASLFLLRGALITSPAASRLSTCAP